ncbi:ABC-2 transporter permease [uncultured Dubosiella sp.]|jgi:hypothetical protein|uniref:ABC-2 transporter permease n=1 Tax=uncultured Dubosiella sp. TaxID=1937011 RepID=UPI002086ACF1|nr:ABC-2 transporter permease [uncultured Dubosiella sp.]GJM57023.1 hypothetical protein EROP_07160 [Erysipelotrichaceae bacterium OPF54]
MKGLFVKDFYIVLQNKIFLYITAILFIGMLIVPGQSIYFIVPYLGFMLVTDTLGTISYDEYNNGFKALFTLPVTRAQYVQEKYVLVLTAGVVIPFILCAVCALCGMITFSDLGMIFITLFIITVFMGGIAIPCYLKFGMEKGKIVNVAILMVAIFLITTLSDPQMFLAQKNVLNDPLVLWLAGAAMLLVLGISYTAALKIMAGKEF